MSFVEVTAGISVLISLILTISTVIKNRRENKMAIEAKMPIFIMEKMESFQEGKYSLLIRNVNDNYFVIKNVVSSDERANARYEGVFEISTKQREDGEMVKRNFKGHGIELSINTRDELDVAFEITGNNFYGKKFIVRTPVIKFRNFRKLTNVQDRYLEFIKK